ncbi:MAG: UMP kinase [Ignisphaera sp.]|uniref:Uridylate kinase n=1 Tax=Ignisphaera aggregans TaxID=334771 RepID=A0A7C4JK05_9CREN
MTKKILIKISGKIANPDNPELIKAYANTILDLYRGGYRLAVVVGGGRYARNYITSAKTLGLNDAQADMVGIEIARVNALLLALSIGDDAYTPIPRNIDDVQIAWSTGKIIVIGGLQPGQSTAAVAAVVAESLGIKTILYATDVEGVYDKDPKRYSDAKKLDVVTIEQLKEIVSQRFEAGGYELLDPIAIQIIKRSCTEVTIFNGTNAQNIYRALEKQVGTRIKPC